VTADQNTSIGRCPMMPRASRQMSASWSPTLAQDYCVPLTRRRWLSTEHAAVLKTGLLQQLLPQECGTVCCQTYEKPRLVILPVQAVAEDIFIWTARPRRIVNCINCAVYKYYYLLTYLKSRNDERETNYIHRSGSCCITRTIGSRLPATCPYQFSVQYYDKTNWTRRVIRKRDLSYVQRLCVCVRARARVCVSPTRVHGLRYRVAASLSQSTKNSYSGTVYWSMIYEFLSLCENLSRLIIGLNWLQLDPTVHALNCMTISVFAAFTKFFENNNIYKNDDDEDVFRRWRRCESKDAVETTV